MENVIRSNGVEHIELISVNDEHHMHFYKKLGFYAASNLAMILAGGQFFQQVEVWILI